MPHMGYVHIELSYITDMIDINADYSVSVIDDYKPFFDKYNIMYVKDGDIIYHLNSFFDLTDENEIIEYASENYVHACIYMDISDIMELYDDLIDLDICTIFDIGRFESVGKTSNEVRMYKFSFDAEAG